MQTSLPARVGPGIVARRHFTTALRAMLASAVAAGCGGSAGGPSPTAPTSRDITGVVSANHAMPHVAVITAAQLAAAAPIVLDISNGLHSHTVAFTGAEVAQIAGGTRVSQVSSTNPHSDGSGPHQHTVTFN